MANNGFIFIRLHKQIVVVFIKHSQLITYKVIFMSTHDFDSFFIFRPNNAVREKSGAAREPTGGGQARAHPQDKPDRVNDR